MNKEELIGKIEQLPLFHECDMSVHKDDELHKQVTWKAIVEENSTEAIAVPKKGFQLVQLPDSCKPMVTSIEGDLNGHLAYWNGKVIMDIFPESDEYNQNNNQYGIEVKNSVDCTSSLIIRFSVLHNGRYLSFPKSVAGFKRTHRKQNLLNIAKTYSFVIAKVQKEWETITEEFPKRILDGKTVVEIVKDKKLGFGEKMQMYLATRQRVAQYHGGEYSLWYLFNDAIDFVAGKSYKTELHKRNQVDGIVEKMIDYSFLTKLVI